MKLMIEPNMTYPMHGLFFNLLRNSFPISEFIQVQASSTYTSDQWLLPMQLIENKLHPNGWASQNIPEQYIEITFLNSSMKFTGYSIKTPYHSDEIPRNWRIICYDLFANWIVDSHTNDKSLNPEVSGGFSSKSDEKFFFVNYVKSCRTIKIQSTGLNSRNQYFLEFAAFDLFGEFYTDNSLSQFCKSIIYKNYFNQYFSYSLNIFLLI